MPVYNEIQIQNNSNVVINEVRVFIQDTGDNTSLTLTSLNTLDTQILFTGNLLIIDTPFGTSGSYSGYIDIFYSKPGETSVSCERRLIFTPTNACFTTIEYWEVDITTP